MERQIGKSNKSKGMVATAGLLLLSKAKWLFAILKFSKFGATFISLIVSLAGYAVFYGWRFAFALVYLIFIHEMGHLVAARQKGIKTSPAVFIPFMGAVIGMKELPKDAATEAYLAYGGPLAGLVSVLPAMLFYYVGHNPFWLLVMMLGAIINLFNLFPVSPLDGGRIVSVLSTKIWLVGLVVLIIYTFISPSPILFLILFFGILTWWRRVRESYRRQLTQYDKQQKVKWRETLLRYQQELFYPVRSEDGDELFLNEGMKLYFLREQRNRQQDVQYELSKMSRFYFPFIEDQKKLERDRYKMESDLISKKIWALESIGAKNDIYKVLSGVEKDVEKLEKDLKKMKVYYQAEASTKWKILVAYIGLALVLGVIYFYSKGLLHQVQPTILLN